MEKNLNGYYLFCQRIPVLSPSSNVTCSISSLSLRARTSFFTQNSENEIDSTERDMSSSKFAIGSRMVKVISNHPLKSLLGSIVFSIILSCIGVIVGNFSLAVDNEGWRSRGTLISKREMQNEILSIFKNDLFQDEDGSTWEELENNVQSSYVELDDESRNDRRKLQDMSSDVDPVQALGGRILNRNLVAIYKTEPGIESSSVSILQPEVLLQVCEAETVTIKALEENGVCLEYEGGCYPPVSLILVIREQLGGFDMSCTELMEEYTTIQEDFKNSLLECTNEILENYDPVTMSYGTTTSCPRYFFPSMVDSTFAIDGVDLLRYSSSIFITFGSEHQDVYDVTPEYGSTDGVVVGSAYDTLGGIHTDIYVDSVLLSDMALALASLFITFTAMCVHTKSLWLTFMGVLQLIISIPLTYFVYYFIFGLRFFPFLNFIGVFVAAALGADGVFVAVDKWKNARIEHPNFSTEEVASIALPNAASAMLLTTSTTAVAFFATAICPVAPIMCFALFCGLMIVFGYILNILFIFPALCAYDIWIMKGKQNFLVTFACCKKNHSEMQSGEEKMDADMENDGNQSETEKSNVKNESLSLIHRILSFYYYYLHKFRFGIIIIFVVGTAVCLKFALSIKLPDSVDVRLLPDNNPYELHYSWRSKLLSTGLFLNGFTFGSITWGIVPADNGVRSNPESLSKLVLDETFNPSSVESQSYLVGFCDKLFSQDFASPREPGVKCPINQFDEWLGSQALSDSPSDEYLTFCNKADSLPMSEEDFDPCLISWSKLTREKNVFGKVGKVTVLNLRITMETPWDAPYKEMDKFWKKFEDWMEQERSVAPEGVNKMYQSAAAFWWYDTNASMLKTAIGAAGIAIAFSAVVVLFSSRSFSLTLFSGFCITYVLAATTASLVGFGWELGFLESVCFSILIGISCDFVIHFGHAYIHSKEPLSRTERSKYALIHMGPSILAASFTTIAAAVVMLFCKVTFFRKFALILFMTIIHATIGSFIIYLVFSDSFGPAEPTKFVDGILSKIKGAFSSSKSSASATGHDPDSSEDESS